MKKLTASIVASALMISAMGINAFAANGTPEIKVYGNKSNPVTAGETASFIVRLSDFANIKGMDLTIESEKGNVIFTGASMDRNVDLKTGSNVKVEQDKIHIVDLTSADMQKDGYANITVNATVNGADTIKVIATLAKDGKNTVTADYKFDNLAVKPEEKSADAGTLNATDGYFIPYGFIKDGDTYVNKAANGSFEVPKKQNYTEFEIPANGIMTFGYSYHKSNTALQFGTYTNESADKRGTLLFEGDWEAFKNYYITEKGYTVEEILAKIYAQYERKNKADSTLTAIKIPAGNNSSIIVRRVEQKKSMWAVNSKNLLQYAARLTGIDNTKTYSGVGYRVSGETVTFSEKVMTAAPAAQS